MTAVFPLSGSGKRQEGTLGREGSVVKADFVMFGLDHLAALLAVALGSAIAFRAGQARWAGIANAVAGVLFSGLAIGLWIMRLNDGFQAGTDLPLFLCDVAFLLCVACFFRPHPLPLTLVAYWGLAGTLQAMITPDLPYAFPSKEYFLFFVGHGVIVIAVFFLVGKTRSANLLGWRGIRTAFLGLLVYTAVVGTIDAAGGWNYGYLYAKPGRASILDSLGPWPYYVVGALVLSLPFFLMVAGLLRLLWKLFPGVDQAR